MKRYKVQQRILCEVRVWGYVEADNMHDAIDRAMEAGTSNFEGFDHEIVTDRETLSMSVETVTPVETCLPDDGLTEKLVALIY
jgi:hypothetical protein